MLGARRQTILDNIHVRDVLYYSAAVDVTDQVTKFLKGWDPKK